MRRFVLHILRCFAAWLCLRVGYEHVAVGFDAASAQTLHANAVLTAGNLVANCEALLDVLLIEFPDLAEDVHSLPIDAPDDDEEDDVD